MKGYRLTKLAIVLSCLGLQTATAVTNDYARIINVAGSTFNNSVRVTDAKPSRDCAAAAATDRNTLDSNTLNLTNSTFNVTSQNDFNIFANVHGLPIGGYG